MHFCKYLSILIVFALTSLVSIGYAEQEERVSTLWSDKKNCFADDAFLISIETFKDTYKVAACAPLGCRIAVEEFGKKAHPGDYRNDPKFNWFSDTEFETQINGSKKHFFHCLTKRK